MISVLTVRVNGIRNPVPTAARATGVRLHTSDKRRVRITEFHSDAARSAPSSSIRPGRPVRFRSPGIA